MPHATPEQKAKRQARRAVRYATDPAFRAKEDARVKAFNKKKYATDPEYRASERSRNRAIVIKATYGVTPAHFDVLWLACGGRCQVCRRTLKYIGSKHERKDVACVDHCHASGEVRGLLCTRCNAGVGQLRDSAYLLRAAAAYIEAA